MGTFAEDTRCAYCAVRQALYIPDGAALCHKRLLRLWKGLLADAELARPSRLNAVCDEVGVRVASFLWFR